MKLSEVKQIIKEEITIDLLSDASVTISQVQKMLVNSNPELADELSNAQDIITSIQNRLAEDNTDLI